MPHDQPLGDPGIGGCRSGSQFPCDSNFPWRGLGILRGVLGRLSGCLQQLGKKLLPFPFTKLGYLRAAPARGFLDFGISFFEFLPVLGNRPAPAIAPGGRFIHAQPGHSSKFIEADCARQFPETGRNPHHSNRLSLHAPPRERQ